MPYHPGSDVYALLNLYKEQAGIQLPDLTPDSSLQEIDEHLGKLYTAFHPAKNKFSNTTCTLATQDINRAFELMLDAGKKAQYDAERRNHWAEGAGDGVTVANRSARTTAGGTNVKRTPKKKASKAKRTPKKKVGNNCPRCKVGVKCSRHNQPNRQIPVREREVYCRSSTGTPCFNGQRLGRCCHLHKDQEPQGVKQE